MKTRSLPPFLRPSVLLLGLGLLATAFRLFAAAPATPASATSAPKAVAPAPAASAPVAKPAPVPAPAAPIAPPANEAIAYNITITDLLRIDVFQEDDLKSTARVTSKGSVNLPLVGEVIVAGMPVDEAQKAIEKAYQVGRYLRSPQVTINIEQYAPRQVSIQGEVKAPGRYDLPIESTLTVVELVTKAGGLTDLAKGIAKVIRFNREGKQEIIEINVKAIIQGRDGKATDNSLKLRPGDNVYVDQNWF